MDYVWQKVYKTVESQFWTLEDRLNKLGREGWRVVHIQAKDVRNEKAIVTRTDYQILLEKDELVPRVYTYVIEETK